MLRKEELEKLVKSLVKLQLERRALVIRKAFGKLQNTSLLKKKKVEIARLLTLVRQNFPSSEFKSLRKSILFRDVKREKVIDVHNKTEVKETSK